MAQDFAIGIDLGTSTSEICVYQKGDYQAIPDPSSKVPVVPSIVALDTKGKLLIGEIALGRVDIQGQGVREVKRRMGTAERVKLGNQEYRPEEISAFILRKLKENAEEYLGTTIKEVVISVPANFPDAARQATLNAGELAGLKILRLINEPTAAALAFGINNIDVEEQLVVFDFGGGTLDITVLEMVAGVLDVKSSFGDPYLGGKDFDEKMIALILGKFQAQYPNAQISERARLELKKVAEATKKSLSNHLSYTATFPNFAIVGNEPIDLDIEITREEFEQAIKPLLDRARECVRQALSAKKLRPSAIDRVLLVGGTTYVPAVRKMVAEIFGREPKADVNPDLAVGIGASISAALAKDLISEESGIILTDVAPFGLGIEIVSEIGGQVMLTYEPLILPNTTIPYSVKKTYSLMRANQTEVEVKLYQDHTGKARFPADAVDTGIVGNIIDIPPAADGVPYPIEVEFYYNTNGIAKVKAIIPAINKSVEIAYGKSDVRMDEKEKEEATQRLQEIWRQNEKSKGYTAIIEKAERFMANMPVSERPPLSDAVANLKAALTRDDDQEIEAAGECLIDLMFDLENME
ncbi:MAG TPA: Hsp70 family protein [Nostocaceae cyanobacterium]|nr:Hsp70 family protein [Nostocaceae cyanobacterium]